MTAEALSTTDWGTVLVALIGAASGAIVAMIAARGKRREDTQTLIDQLQEERKAYTDMLREERTVADARMDRMWADKAASRQHVADLRAHINRGDPPPPPTPPEGYIE